MSTSFSTGLLPMNHLSQILLPNLCICSESTFFAMSGSLPRLRGRAGVGVLNALLSLLGVMLFHNDSAVQSHLYLLVRRLSLLHPPCTNGKKCSGGYTRANRCTGGNSRASRHAKMSIRRIALVLPPAISAGNLQILHKLRINNE